MTTPRSLISRIAAKDVFTPYEAILIQYLNRKYMAQQVPDISIDANFYASTSDIRTLYSQQDLKQILAFNTLSDAQEYDAYKWTADLLVQYDTDSKETAYRAIALLSELRYFRDESLINFLTNKDHIVKESLQHFVTFSHVHQKRMSFYEIIYSFIFSLEILTMTVDNVLTLNHFLNGMVENEDLLCLTNLIKILNMNDNESDDDNQLMAFFNIVGFDHKILFNQILSINHPRFINVMQDKLSLFNWQLSPSFNKNSLDYVKKTVSEAIV
jgi:hypothetical protein